MSPAAVQTQRAQVLHGPKNIQQEDRVVWPPAPGEAQVAVLTTGLCGSDLHYYIHGRNGDFVVRDPLVLGHESAGVITALGPGVTHLRVGQRVAIEAGIMCERCEFCLAGRYNLCVNMRFCSSAKTHPHLDGTLQERMNHPAKLLYPLPDNVSLTAAAMAEPLSVLIHASRRAFAPVHSTIPSAANPHLPLLNKSVLVLGVGPIGLLACLLAKSKGAKYVVAADINRQRLEFTKNEGFCDIAYCIGSGVVGAPCVSSAAAAEKGKSSEIVNGSSTSSPSSSSPTPEQSSAALIKCLSSLTLPLNPSLCGQGFDLSYECTGVDACVSTAILSAKPGSKVVLVGMGGKKDKSVPLGAAFTREVDLVGSFRYCGTYPEALELLAGSPGTGTESSLDFSAMVSKLVTQRYDLSKTKAAFETVARGKDEEGNLVVKVVVNVNGAV